MPIVDAQVHIWGSGPPTNPGMGTGAQATGNLTGAAPTNSVTGFLTGIVLPEGIRDPYVYNDFLSIQREIMPRMVLEVDYVGTVGHKLFRSEQINRMAGGRLPTGTCITDNFGRNLCSLRTAVDPSGLPNANYNRLRVWENSVNSDYSALQLSLKKQMSHGLLFNLSYSWSHSIDEGSTWHSGATTANGGAAGDGYTTDVALPRLDRGNSVFDIRHRLVLNYVWELPGQKLHGATGAVAGGWTLNGVWSFQSGAHWSPFNSLSSSLGGDYNLDNGRNDRPNSSLASFGNFSRNTWANGWGASSQSGLPVLTTPSLGFTGNLGRNTFVGPGQWLADMALAKNFSLTEQLKLKFEWQTFNVFNRANFLLATTGGGAHNEVNDSLFGAAAGTLNARNMQFGLKLSF